MATVTPQLPQDLSIVGGPTFKSLKITDTSGTLNITSASDGADYNIFSSNGAQTLAIYGSAGNSLSLNLLDGNLSIGDGGNIILGTTNGTKIGTATTQKIGFFNATPVVQGSTYTLSNNSTSRSLNVSTATVGQVANVLATLLVDLKTFGLFA